MWSSRVLSRLRQLVSEGGQEVGQVGHHCLLQSRERSHHRLHHVFILAGAWQVEGGEQVLQKVLGQRGQVLGFEQSFTLSILHDQDLVDGGRRVGVDDHERGLEKLHKGGKSCSDRIWWQHRAESHDVLHTVSLGEIGEIIISNTRLIPPINAGGD